MNTSVPVSMRSTEAATENIVVIIHWAAWRGQHMGEGGKTEDTHDVAPQRFEGIGNDAMDIRTANE